MSSKPNSRDRRRLLQGGSSQAPKSAAKPARDRSSLPGFDQHPELPLAAKTPGSHAKKQQSKLNTPTKARTTPAVDDAAAERGGMLEGASGQKTPTAADPYEFPADDAADAQDAAAVNPPLKLHQRLGRRLEGLHHFQPHKNSLSRLVSAGGVTASKRTVSSSNRQLDFNSSAAAHGISNLGLSITGLRTGTAPDVATSASAGYSKQWLAAATGGRQKQTGIRNFTVPQKLLSPSASGLLPAGMVNHGNTCYLNAVLQALLGLKCLGDDLSSSRLQQLSLSSNGVTHALQSCLQHRSSSGASSGSDRAISPAAVSAAMAQLDSRWGLSRQEDAHEFLTALLDALQTEVLTAQAALLKSTKTATSVPHNSSTTTATAGQHAAESAATAGTGLDQPAHDSSSDALHNEGHTAAVHSSADHGPCVSASTALDPSSRNFTGCLQHTLTCSCCGHVTIVKEQFNHLSLDLPALGSFLQSQQSLDPPCSSGVLNLLGGIGSPEQVVPELQSLLANFFAPEMLEKSCEACKAAAVQHSLHHAVRRLPRVLVVHLKRFQWQVLTGGGAICRKMSTRVKPDAQLHLGGVCCPGRPVPPLIAELAPPGVIERAQQAMQDQQTAAATAPASPRRTGATQQHEAAATAPAAAAVGFKRAREVETETKALLGGQQHTITGNASREPQQDKQQNLLTAWVRNQVAGKSRFERMMSVNGQAFHAHRGARHTDLTKLVQQPEQQNKVSCLNSDPAVLDQGHDADVEDDFGGFERLKRNNSSTALVDLVQDDAEDDELQRAIAESLRMQGEQQQHRSPSAGAAAAEDDEVPPSKAARLAVTMSPGSPAAAAVDKADDDDDDDDDGLPDWVAQQHASGGGKAAAYRSPPSTPRSSPKLKYKPYTKGRRKIMYTNASRSRSRQPLTDLTGQDDLYTWGADGHEHDQQQQDTVVADVAAGTSGSGGVGLSGGLAFSDPAAPGASGGPASVQQQRQQQTGSARGLFDGLPLLSAAAAAAGDGGGFIPGSPTCPQPGRAAGATANGKSNNNSNDSSVMHIDNNALGLSGLTEDQQVALAIEESMKQQQQQPAGGDSSSGPAKVLAGIDVENYDEQAALEKALAESAAAAEQPAPSSGAAAVPTAAAAAGSDQLVENAQQCCSDGVADQAQQPSAAAAASGESDVAEDDTVVLVHEGAEAAADQQQQPRPRLPLVRLVEDSDCEDDAPPDAHQTQQQQQQPTTPEPMEINLPGQPPSDVATATTASSPLKSEALIADKENTDQLQQGCAGGKPRKQRRPFGKILSDVNTNIPAVLVPTSALAPPVKPAGMVAAVAASQAAAAGAAALSSADLAAAEAAAAAEAVGHWPQEDAALYKLRAVVRHKGPLASSGHFVSDVKSNLQGGVWFHYDDSYVQSTQFHNVVRDCQQDGYLFFYVNSAILPLHTPKGV